MHEQSRGRTLILAGAFDAEDPSAWSGIPLGLRHGLESLGVTVVPLDSRPSRRVLRRILTRCNTIAARAGLGLDPHWSSLQTARTRRLLRMLPSHDAVIQIGTGIRGPYAAPFATYEDMTLALALSTGFMDPEALTSKTRERWNQRQWEVYSRAAVCCVASGWAARSIVQDYGMPESKVKVVGFGANLEIRKVSRDWTRPRFLFVGMDWGRKRGDDVVRAFVQLRTLHPEATLDLVGDHPPIDVPGVLGHGPLERRSGEDQRRLVQLFAQATCLVLPSIVEPFGIVHVEAGSFGIPSIGTTVGGAPEAMGPGGITVPPGDDAALMGAMLHLAEPAAARRLGDLALAHARTFTWTAVARRVLAALDGAEQYLALSPPK